MTKEKKEAVKENRFFKQQIISSETYKDHKDILRALLEDEKTYSHAEIEKIIEGFMKRKVK